MANKPLLTGEITFIQNHLSALLAGEYMVRVDQHVQNTDADAAPAQQFNENYYNEKRFAVTAPRFSLQPTAFYNIFPPANNQGEYDNVLPHVVFNSKSLPWIRTPDGTDDGKPWLALLLFEESEILASQAATRPIELPATTQVGDLQKADFLPAKDATQKRASTLPADTISYPALDASKPHMPVGQDGLDYGENWWDSCRAIDIPLDLWQAIAPAYSSEVGPDQKGDLQLLAHARSVKSNVTKSAQGGNGQNDFSVVVCNRMPTPNSRCVAHLVSVENLQEATLGTAFLPTVDAQGNYQPGTFPNGIKYLRLVSLKSWSFTSVDPKETFTQFLENLDVGAFQIPMQEGSHPALQVAGPLAMGYTAVNHLTRQGDKTVSWYRGPFLPIAAPKIFEPLPDPTTNPVSEPLRSADEALRYDPSTGMMDVTYSAAWQLGLLLGIQNKSFSVALTNWKRVNTHKTVLSLEASILREKLGDALALEEGSLTDTQTLQAAAAALLAGPLKPHLHPED